MAIYLAKLSENKGQIKITIPKKLVEETGIDEFPIVQMKRIGKREIELKGWEYGKKEKDGN